MTGSVAAICSDDCGVIDLTDDCFSNSLDECDYFSTLHLITNGHEYTH